MRAPFESTCGNTFGRMDTELPDKKGVLLDMYDEVSFSRDVSRPISYLE